MAPWKVLGATEGSTWGLRVPPSGQITVFQRRPQWEVMADQPLGESSIYANATVEEQPSAHGNWRAVPKGSGRPGGQVLSDI